MVVGPYLPDEGDSVLPDRLSRGQGTGSSSGNPRATLTEGTAFPFPQAPGLKPRPKARRPANLHHRGIEANDPDACAPFRRCGSRPPNRSSHTANRRDVTEAEWTNPSVDATITTTISGAPRSFAVKGTVFYASMGSNPPHLPVYWIEADEEAALFAPKAGPALARRALLAYTLLQRSIVAHPADFWQSHFTNALVLDIQAQPILRDLLRIHLGDSPTIREYILDRVTKLRDDKASLSTHVELAQYDRYAAKLNDHSAQLDEVFTQHGSTYTSSESRDKRFRDLILADLDSAIPYGPHLSSCIRQGLRPQNADKVKKTLRALAHDGRRFISIDGVIARLRDARCSESMLDRIFARLQMLHWEARGDPSVELPLLSRARNNSLDSADPNVFWIAVDKLVGPECQQALMALPWSTALGIAHNLRRDPVWERFLVTYDVIVETVQDRHVEIAEQLVASRVMDFYPPQYRILLRMPDKWLVLSIVCHLGSWIVGANSGFGLIFKLGSGVGAIKKVYDHAAAVERALFDSDRAQISSRVRSLIAEATRTK